MRLRVFAAERLGAGDETSCRLLTEVMAFVQQGNYAAAARHFLQLDPDLRSKIGKPPMSRDEDLPRGDRKR